MSRRMWLAEHYELTVHPLIRAMVASYATRHGAEMHRLKPRALLTLFPCLLLGSAVALPLLAHDTWLLPRIIELRFTATRSGISALPSSRRYQRVAAPAASQGAQPV